MCALFQGGPFVEVFSTQGSGSIQASPKLIILASNKNAVKKAFDKDVKSYVITILPSSNNQGVKFVCQQLLHRFLILQLHVSQQTSITLEFLLRTSDQQRRRIIFSSNFRDLQVTDLHTKMPLFVKFCPTDASQSTLDICWRNTWMNLCFDLQDLCQYSFAKQTTQQQHEFSCLEEICIGPVCKLRKIFTMKQNPITQVFIPKNLQFVSGVTFETFFVDRFVHKKKDGEMDEQVTNDEENDAMNKSNLSETKKSPTKRLVLERKPSVRPKSTATTTLLARNTPASSSGLINKTGKLKIIPTSNNNVTTTISPTKKQQQQVTFAQQETDDLSPLSVTKHANVRHSLRYSNSTDEEEETYQVQQVHKSPSRIFKEYDHTKYEDASVIQDQIEENDELEQVHGKETPSETTIRNNMHRYEAPDTSNDDEHDNNDDLVNISDEDENDNTFEAAHRSASPKLKQDDASLAQSMEQEHEHESLVIPDKENMPEDEEEEIELVYDPLLQCYYDPKSNKFYDVKQ